MSSWAPGSRVWQQHTLEKLSPFTFAATTIPSPSVCSLQTIPLKYPETTTFRSIVYAPLLQTGVSSPLVPWVGWAVTTAYTPVLTKTSSLREQPLL